MILFSWSVEDEAEYMGRRQISEVLETVLKRDFILQAVRSQ